MYELVSKEHVYVAQPPLYRVIKGKARPYYVQTDEEMKAQLMERGVTDSELILEGEKKIAGAKMQQLATTLAGMENDLLALERRGISLKSIAQHAKDGKLPEYHVFEGGEELWWSRAQFQQFADKQQASAGKEIAVSDETANISAGPVPSGEPSSNGHPVPDAPRFRYTHLLEVISINQGLADLRDQFGFDLAMLIPQERTGSDQPRYVLRRGEHDVALKDLRGLAAAVREMGQKGLHVTRFKGLGEMNAEELRETTLDPANRTLVKVTMQDLGAADDMFRVLMGDKVEPRREFIEKHALEVRNLDV
jgi:DNA gyrase subunit B